MNGGLEKLNHIPPETARTAFLSCCGSRRWAERMTEARPFAGMDELINRAKEIWQNLEPEDWLEAFAAHPKIGARKAASQQSEQSAQWSQNEQSGVLGAENAVLSELAEANRLYEEKFGYIFIVCATGKTAEEMLALCQERLKNESLTELQTAAEEQRKITEIRLKKLLEAEI
ncbi:MAG: 2-oxo-4-hydroxy-4-carboxy-5-ureidoimidazoline decarboxylase [Acidobacteriota bacterium]|nr:2-oxo-4-hydroxy-4-carboxy-5-ureidoimidazoline decarboxylase [Acidobacteriota bacterium]